MTRAKELQQCQLRDTVMSQLGRIPSFDKSDPRFLSFLEALAKMMEERGLSWIGEQGAANIVHAIAKMKLKNQSTKKILEWISKPDTAAKFVEEGEPQACCQRCLGMCRTWF